jgi:DME family drug/metabolite transporter
VDRLAPSRPAGTRSTGLLAVALPCTLWGSVGLLVRQLDLPAVVIADLRLGFASLGVLLLGLLRAGEVRLAPRGHWQRLALLGVLMAVNWWLFILAFQLTGIGVTVVLSFSWPLWLALSAHRLGQERPRLATMVALGVSLAGMVLLAARGGHAPAARDLAGMAAALATSLLFAVNLLVSRSVDAALPSATLNFWQTTIATAVLAPFTVLGQGGVLDARSLAILVVLGAVMTGAAGTAFVLGVRLLTPTEIGVVSYLEPVSATILAALVLGEDPGVRGDLGIALLIAAGVWVVLRGGGSPEAGRQGTPDRPVLSQPPASRRPPGRRRRSCSWLRRR